MEGQGEITFQVEELEKVVRIDVTDTGKGIAKSKFKTVFNPGYTTKKRGWGLGLSLVKRIIESYHGGKIFVKSSDNPNYIVHRLDPLSSTKDRCDKCQNMGYDYVVYDKRIVFGKRGRGSGQK